MLTLIEFNHMVLGKRCHYVVRMNKGGWMTLCGSTGKEPHLIGKSFRPVDCLHCLKNLERQNHEK